MILIAIYQLWNVMKISTIRIYRIEIPFSRTITHQLHTRNETQSIIVELEDYSGNRGFGEGAPREYVTGENLENCLYNATAYSKEIIGKEIESLEEFNTLLNNNFYLKSKAMYPAALCALEMSFIDLMAKNANTPAYKFLSVQAKCRAVSYSGVIPYIQDCHELNLILKVIRELKLKAIKIKVVDTETGLSQLKYIRDVLGYDIDIRVDANAAFTAETAIDFIQSAKDIQLSAVEQPVPKEDLVGLRMVSDHFDIPIIADESMYTSKGPYYLIENDICDGLNVRLSSCGGLSRAYQLYSKAKQKNMVIVLGAHVGETAILSLAGRSLAMICQDAKYIEGSYSKYLLNEDIVRDDISFGAGGIAFITDNPGLGINLDVEVLEKWSTLHAHLHESGSFD